MYSSYSIIKDNLKYFREIVIKLWAQHRQIYILYFSQNIFEMPTFVYTLHITYWKLAEFLKFAYSPQINMAMCQWLIQGKTQFREFLRLA